MYRNAIVATDGSEVAAAIFKHVREVLDPEGTVTVVEVIDDVAHVFARATPAGFEYGAAAFDSRLAESIVQAQRDAAEQHLAAACESLESEGIKRVETALLSGLPGDVIVQEVARRRADIVLMGTHGRSGLRRTVLGSVADYVLRHLDSTPVLLVHAHEH